MPRSQGKNFGWRVVKGKILLAVINGYNSREKLKALLSPGMVSTKDIDHHLRGTELKPGLIRRGLLKEKGGELALNLSSVGKLSEIIVDFLLDIPGYKEALDLEFSACYLSDFGDSLSAVHSLTEDDSAAFRDYSLWIKGYREEWKRGLTVRMKELGMRLMESNRGNLSYRDKIDYIVALHAITQQLPKNEDEPLDENKGAWDLSLAWRDMNLIKGVALNAPKDLIEMVFDRLNEIANGRQPVPYFPDYMSRADYGLFEAHGMIQTILFEGLDKLSFDLSLYSELSVIGSRWPHLREIIKILRANQYIAPRELDRLWEILKAFNDSQRDPSVRYILSETERFIERFHGKMVP